MREDSMYELPRYYRISNTYSTNLHNYSHHQAIKLSQSTYWHVYGRCEKTREFEGNLVTEHAQKLHTCKYQESMNVSFPAILWTNYTEGTSKTSTIFQPEQHK